MIGISSEGFHVLIPVCRLRFFLCLPKLHFPVPFFVSFLVSVLFRSSVCLKHCEFLSFLLAVHCEHTPCIDTRLNRSVESMLTVHEKFSKINGLKHINWSDLTIGWISNPGWLAPPKCKKSRLVATFLPATVLLLNLLPSCSSSGSNSSPTSFFALAGPHLSLIATHLD